MKVPFVRNPYNYDVMTVSNETGLFCSDDSLAVQSAKEECDINTIVRRFGLTGELPNNVALPQSGDFVGVGDFHGAMNVVRAAQEEFMKVPADVRARFLNDPGRMIAFVEDDGNRLEAERLGLLQPRPVIPVVGDVAPSGA